MTNGERITLSDIVSPELRAYADRVEMLEREKADRGEYVEVMDSSWLPDLEARLMVESDHYVVDLLLRHADMMTALMLHRRISNLEKYPGGDWRL